MRSWIDLNADVGESFGRWSLGDDAGVLAQVSSANLACGFHAGDPVTLCRTAALAVHAGAALGAQVGYRDLAGFGRRFLDASPTELAADVLYQLAALDGIVRAAGGAITYLKPHGALYHALTHHQGQVRGTLDALLAFDRPLTVVGPPGSLLLAEALQAGLPVVVEGFCDRAYAADGSLVPRTEPGSVLSDPDVVAAQAVSLATTGTVVAVDGSSVRVDPTTLCVHGDSPGAAALAAAVRRALGTAGVEVAAFG